MVFNLMTPSKKLSLDWWSVLWALLAVVLVKSGILPHIAW
jgi:hypothetical protein